MIPYSSGGRRPAAIAPTVLLLLIGIIFASAGVMLWLLSEQFFVLLPALGALTILVLVYFITAQRRGPALNEMGLYYISAVCLYTIVPLGTYTLRGFTFTVHNDTRLFAAKPTPLDMTVHGCRYLVYLAACAAAYLLSRRGPREAGPHLDQSRPHLLRTAVTLAIVMQALLFLLSITLNIRGDTYEEWNTDLAATLQTIPLVLQQVLVHLPRGLLAIKALILVALFARYKEYSVVIWCWCAAEAASVIFGAGSRTPMVLLVLMVVFLYHRFVGGIRARTAAFLALALLSWYFIAGLTRNVRSYSSGTATLENSSNECESLFGTSYDVYKRAQSGGLPSVPLQVYFSDAVALVPSQLLPFTKWSGSEWYLEVLGLRGTGVGFTFGAISEAMIGWGWLELVLRGAFVGWCMAKVHLWYLNRSGDVMSTALYVWATALSYQSFRASTFQVAVMAFLELMPVYLFISLLAPKRRRSNVRQGSRGAILAVRSIIGRQKCTKCVS